MSKHLFTPQIDENLYLNTTHRVNLTGGEISTILFYLQQVCENNMTDDEPEIDRVFAELESVTDSYYAYQEELELNRLRKLEEN